MKNSQNDNDDGPVVLPKKKGDGSKSKKSVSPVMQVMQAVTKAATNPGKKKKAPLPEGPSKANDLTKKPQKQARKDKADGPSAEVKGKA